MRHEPQPIEAPNAGVRTLTHNLPHIYRRSQDEERKRVDYVRGELVEPFIVPTPERGNDVKFNRRMAVQG